MRADAKLPRIPEESNAGVSDYARNTATSLLPEIGGHRNESAGFALEPPGIDSQDEMIVVDQAEDIPDITLSAELPAIVPVDTDDKPDATASAELPALVSREGATSDVPQQSVAEARPEEE